jgi:hypothetical protein
MVSNKFRNIGCYTPCIAPIDEGTGRATHSVCENCHLEVSSIAPQVKGHQVFLSCMLPGVDAITAVLPVDIYSDFEDHVIDAVGSSDAVAICSYIVQKLNRAVPNGHLSFYHPTSGDGGKQLVLRKQCHMHPPAFRRRQKGVGKGSGLPSPNVMLDKEKSSMAAKGGVKTPTSTQKEAPTPAKKASPHPKAPAKQAESKGKEKPTNHKVGSTDIRHTSSRGTVTSKSGARERTQRLLDLSRLTSTSLNTPLHSPPELGSDISEVTEGGSPADDEAQGNDGEGASLTESDQGSADQHSRNGQDSFDLTQVRSLVLFMLA